jgi:cobalamin biosynthetic protein CobC
LHDSGARLQQLLAAHGITASGTALYQYWPEARATEFAAYMAQHGLWIRLFSHGVRIGLPPDESGWQRLQQALLAWTITQEIE